VKNYYISKGQSENSETFLAYQGEYKQRKHSKLGISSFIAAVASILLFIFGFNIGNIPYDTGASLEEMLSSSPNLFIAALLYILGFALSLVGFGLGIAGIFTRNKRKVYAIWGSVINGTISTILILAFVLAASYLKGTAITFVNKAIISCFNKM